MQNIIILDRILWVLLKKEDESQLLIINKIRAIFDFILAPRQKFKNLICSFFCINTRSPYAKSHPSSFKTEGGDRG